MAKYPMKDIVVLLPGITGSVLQKDGKDVWALNGGAALQAILSLGHSITDLELGDDSPDADDLGDGVVATRLMPDTHLIPGLWKIDGYGKVERRLLDTFDLTPGKNYFPFPYDWRRDNRAHARRLARDAPRWLSEWRAQSGNDDAQLVLIGHSMGGIVARSFLEEHAGWRMTRRLVTFGTPYRGSLNALSFLVNGMSKKLGPIKLIDLTKLLRSCTSVYQLLPVFSCFDAGGGELVHLVDADPVGEVDWTRVREAEQFHRNIEARVDEHLKDQEYLDQRYHIHPVVGIKQHTSLSARRDDDKVEMLSTYDGEDLEGDGTVPRPSATPIELSDQGVEVYAAGRHASLQNADAILVHLEGLLRDMPIAGFRDRPVRLAVDVDDFYDPDESVAIEIVADAADVAVAVTVTDLTSGDAVRAVEVRAGTEPTAVELPPIPSGTYRLSVSGPAGSSGAGDAVEPVEDVFVVFGEADEAMAGDPVP